MLPLNGGFNYVYRPDNSDNEVEASIAKVINSPDLNVPLIKLNDQCYLFGTEVIQPFMHGNTCVVRIGGGFQPIDLYVQRNQEVHKRAIRKIMEKEGKSYMEVVSDMVYKHLRSNKQVAGVMGKMAIILQRQAYMHFGGSLPPPTET